MSRRCASCFRGDCRRGYVGGAEPLPVERAELLQLLFGVVMIPPEVRVEFDRLASDDARFGGLAVPEWIREAAATNIPATVVNDKNLDAGEIAALALAVECKADAILLDEAAGRLAAKELGLRVIGILGILLQAKQAGFIVAVAPILNELLHKAHFWVSEPLKAEVLHMAGESA